MAHQLQLVKIERYTNVTWDPDRLLTEALAERAQFLEKYPQYRPMQRDIDQILDKAGSSENRMAVLALLIEGKLIEMHDQLSQLNRIILSVQA